MTKLQSILRLSKAVPVFPVKVVKKGKKFIKIPLVKGGFKAATHDPYQIITWWGKNGTYPYAQIGIPTGQASGVWVLDLDVKPKGCGHETMMDHPALPETIKQRTVGGGEHLFFRYPEGVQISSGTNVLGPFVDVRGDGGYAVIAPSEGYEMEGDMWDEAAKPPKWLLKLVKKKNKKKEKPKVKVSDTKPFTEAQVKKYLSKLPVEDYRHRDGWLNVLMGVKAGCHGEEHGLESFIEWSLQDADYFDDDVAETARKEWDTIEVEREGGITGGTLVHQARIHDIETRKETAFEGFTSLDEIETDVDDAWSFQNNGVLSKVEGNLYSMLCCPKIKKTQRGGLHDNPLYKLIGYDELAEAPVFLAEPPWGTKRGRYIGKQVTDSDLHHMMVWIHKMYDVNFGFSKMKDSIPAISLAHAFHPVVDYLDSLEWDGTPRIETWISDYLGSKLPKEDLYLRAVSKRVLVGAVARAYHPGIKNDTMMILESTQGVGKSTAIEVLGGEWFRRPQFDIGHKDAEQNLLGSWINEWGELSDMNKKETEALKNYISSEQTTFRKSFGRLAETVKRKSIIIGTTNPDHGTNEYLKDRTGNRRYWPVAIKGKMKNPKNGKWWINLEGLKKDRDQLWAEAVFMFKAGEKWHLLDEEVTAAEREQRKRQAKDGREGVLISWLMTGDYTKENYVSTYEVATECFGLTPDRAKGFALREYASLMYDIGWRKRNTRHPDTGARGAYWVRPLNWDPYDEGVEAEELE